jgi:Ca2+-binding EF-hand superfamily protein
MELKHAVRTGAYAFGLTREEASILVTGVDANKDNFVDFPEFTALVSKNHKFKFSDQSSFHIKV